MQSSPGPLYVVLIIDLKFHYKKKKEGQNFILEKLYT